jgi:hypothetical protein
MNKTLLKMRNPTPFDKMVVKTSQLEESFTNQNSSGAGTGARYIVDGIPVAAKSVTEYYQSFFAPFPSEAIKRRCSQTKDKSSPYYGKRYDAQVDEIQPMWDAARIRGEKLHEAIEYYYNTDGPDETTLTALRALSADFDRFLCFHRDFIVKKKWTPFRTELAVYDKELNLPGCVDMLFLSKTGKYILCDWKCTNPISESGTVLKSGPFEGYKDSKYTHYRVQLSIYAHIIERNSDIVISKLILVNFGGTGGDTDYTLYEMERIEFC